MSKNINHGLHDSNQRFHCLPSSIHLFPLGRCCECSPKVMYLHSFRLRLLILFTSTYFNRSGPHQQYPINIRVRKYPLRCPIIGRMAPNSLTKTSTFYLPISLSLSLSTLSIFWVFFCAYILCVEMPSSRMFQDYDSGRKSYKKQRNNQEK